MKIKCNTRLQNKPRLINFLFCMSAFFISTLGILLILKSQGFYPFKERTLFTQDLKDQFVAFYTSLRYTVSGDDSPFFSWSRSMGGNYMGLFAYYLASPLSFLTLLFPVEKMYAAIALLTVLKIGLCGGTFSIFASYLWQKSHIDHDTANSSSDLRTSWQQFILLPFAVSYALISYNIIYSQCLMWLDGVILLPLILLGVEKLLAGKKGLLYLICIWAMFVCNYYIAYMVGIFTAVYLIYRIICRWREKKATEWGTIFLRFTITTLMAFGLATPILIPVVKDLAMGKLFSGYETTTIVNFPFLSLLDKLQNGVYDSFTNKSLPYVYCGYAAIGFALLFFFVRKVSLREKLGAVSILALLLFSFYFTKLNTVWHAFQEPVCFPYRYSFLFSFFLLYLSIRTMCVLPLDKLPTIWERKPFFECLVAGLLLIIAADMGINGRTIFNSQGWQVGYTSIEQYENFLKSTKPLIDNIKENDTGFYRINQKYEFSKNDSMLLGYNGMTHFSSTYNNNVNLLTKALGMAQAHYWNTGYGTTPLLDSLFAVKYVLDKDNSLSFYAKLLETTKETVSYENKSALSIAYSAPAVSLSPTLNSPNPFVNQNTLLNSIAGTDLDYFTEYDFTTQQSGLNITYTFTADSSNPVYLYIKSDSFTDTDVYVNGEKIGKYFRSEDNCNLCLGTFVPREQVRVDIIPSREVIVTYVHIAQLHMDILHNTLKQLQNNGLNVISHKGGKLQGTISVKPGEKIMTSIPYDSGWTVKVDGKKVEPNKYADTFLVIETEPGEHELTLSYVSPGFGTGVLVFLIALLCTALYFHYSNKNMGDFYEHHQEP